MTNKIRFAENFDDIFRNKLNFTRSEVRDAVLEHDEVEIIKIDDLELNFFSRTLGNYYMLVLARKEADTLLILAGYKLYPVIWQKLSNKRPLALLEQLAENFGLDIEVAGQKGRFFMSQKIPISAYKRNEVVKVLGKSRGLTSANFFIKPNPNEVHVAICFCIDIERYKEHLQ